MGSTKCSDKNILMSISFACIDYNWIKQPIRNMDSRTVRSFVELESFKIFLVNLVDELLGGRSKIVDGQTAWRYVPALVMVHH